MSNPFPERLNAMLELGRNHKADEISMLVELREEFLDIEAICKEMNHNIYGEVVGDPASVVLYAALYIDMLERKIKQYDALFKNVEEKVENMSQKFDVLEQHTRFKKDEKTF